MFSSNIQSTAFFLLVLLIVRNVVKSEVTVNVVPSPLSVIGEGPHWDADTQSLYYNDIYGNDSSVLRYDFKEDKTYSATIDGEAVVSFIIPVAGTTDQFAVGIGRRVGVIQWDGKSPKAKLLRIAFEVEQGDEYKTNRFNDAKADAHERLYAGTMRLEEVGDVCESFSGAFYKHRQEESVVKLRENVSCSNGLAWNDEINKFYYIDSCTYDVKEFDYDPETGNLSNERVVIDFKVNGEKPSYLADGMTIDTDGNLYVATWGGHKVLKVNPKSCSIELEIEFPAEQVSSVAFGGPNLDILFVTTAATERDSPQPPPAGSLFKVTGLGVKGLGGRKARI